MKRIYAICSADRTTERDTNTASQQQQCCLQINERKRLCSPACHFNHNRKPIDQVCPEAVSCLCSWKAAFLRLREIWRWIESRELCYCDFGSLVERNVKLRFKLTNLRTHKFRLTAEFEWNLIEKLITESTGYRDCCCKKLLPRQNA